MWQAGQIPCLSFVHAPHPIRHIGAHAKVSPNVVKVRREPGLRCGVGRKNSRLTQFTPRVHQTLSVLRRSHLFTAKTQSVPVFWRKKNCISGSEKWHQIWNKSKFESEHTHGEATGGHFHMTGPGEVFLYPPLQLQDSVSMTMRHF